MSSFFLLFLKKRKKGTRKLTDVLRVQEAARVGVLELERRAAGNLKDGEFEIFLEEEVELFEIDARRSIN